MATLKDTILADVKDSLSAPKVGELDATSNVDIEIILGSDVK